MHVLKSPGLTESKALLSRCITTKTKLPGVSERERVLKGSGTVNNAEPAPRMSADLSTLHCRGNKIKEIQERVKTTRGKCMGCKKMKRSKKIHTTYFGQHIKTTAHEVGIIQESC